LEADHRAGHLSSDYRRHSMSNFHDNRNCDRDFKKRKMDDLYMVCSYSTSLTPLIVSQRLLTSRKTPLMVIVHLHLPFRSQFPITSMAIYPPTMVLLVMAVFQATPPRSLICTLPLFIIFLILPPDQVQLQVLHFRRVLFPCESDVMSSKLSMRTFWILVTICFLFHPPAAFPNATLIAFPG
jgi:hypothetical protein